MGDRKDLAMRNQISFSVEFKKQAVEELLNGESRPAQICHRYNISSSLLYHWKRQYSRGRFNNEPTEVAALKDRIEKLEQLAAAAGFKVEHVWTDEKQWFSVQYLVNTGGATS